MDGLKNLRTKELKNKEPGRPPPPFLPHQWGGTKGGGSNFFIFGFMPLSAKPAPRSDRFPTAYLRAPARKSQNCTKNTGAQRVPGSGGACSEGPSRRARPARG